MLWCKKFNWCRPPSHSNESCREGIGGWGGGKGTGQCFLSASILCGYGSSPKSHSGSRSGSQVPIERRSIQIQIQVSLWQSFGDVNYEYIDILSRGQTKSRLFEKTSEKFVIFCKKLMTTDSAPGINLMQIHTDPNPKHWRQTGGGGRSLNSAVPVHTEGARILYFIFCHLIRRNGLSRS